jgi:cellulose synthase/poly-beta-1,6-N-acetylglucosamine synthase-like glycosyltransferase
MRLSVILPAIGSQQEIEDSLVSILSNRLPASEILVVCGPDYVDPYRMEDEVRFVHHRHGGNWAAAANHGLALARGTYVAMLLPGTEVVEGWAQVALRRMDSCVQLASVAPLILDENAASRGIAGLRFTLGGRRLIRTTRIPQADGEPALVRVDGPCRWAGFFRRQALVEAGGWDASISPEIVDLELAVRLRAAGWQSLCERSSWVRVGDALQQRALGYVNARDTERIFWRYLSTLSRIPAVLLHPSAVLVERLSRFTQPSAIGELIGRLSGVRPTARHGLAAPNRQSLADRSSRRHAA